MSLDSVATKRQPPPSGDGEDVTELVLRDLAERKAAGVRKYGVPLRTFNGRDALVDAYQESLDLTVYLRQRVTEGLPGDWFADVLAFHVKFGCATRALPGVPVAGCVDLLNELIREEADELRQAMLRNDLAEIADGAVDLIYVVLGTLVSYGIDPRPVWAEVQSARAEAEAGR